MQRLPSEDKSHSAIHIMILLISMMYAELYYRYEVMYSSIIYACSSLQAASIQ